jgi:thiamine biosynthesis lipoprotein
MGTVVTIHVVRPESDAPGVDDAMDRAFGWFREIESRCTRFSGQSELMQLTAQTGKPVAASAILYEAVQFALLVAEESGGAFDPTVGHRMEARGFNREHRTGEVVDSGIAPDEAVSYRDVALDPERRTITLRRPLTLDLGAVAKGLAVDAAARELAPFRDFAINAGGDLYLGGSNPQGAPWSVGISHPRREGELIDTLQVSNNACRALWKSTIFWIRAQGRRPTPWRVRRWWHRLQCWRTRWRRRHLCWDRKTEFSS